MNFITAMRKENCGMMKSGSYASLRSSFTYLSPRYRYTPSQEFELELKECMEGVKRITNKALQHGEGNLYDGDTQLT
jgi:hypothetical protein